MDDEPEYNLISTSPSILQTVVQLWQSFTIYRCYRCGSLVLLTHDCADIFLEMAKMLHYAKFNALCDGVFAIFLVVWTVTRLGVFPTWIFYRLLCCFNKSNNFQIFYSATVEAPQMIEMFPAYYIFNGLFSILLILHVIWTYFIYKVAYRAATKKVGDN